MTPLQKPRWQGTPPSCIFLRIRFATTMKNQKREDEP